MPPVGFEPTISAGERQQTYSLNRATTGIGLHNGIMSPKFTNQLVFGSEMKHLEASLNKGRLKVQI